MAAMRVTIPWQLWGAVYRIAQRAGIKLVAPAHSCRLPMKAPRGYGSRHHGVPSIRRLFNSPMPANLKAQYAARVAAGKIERDPAQEAVLDMLAGLDARL